MLSRMAPSSPPKKRTLHLLKHADILCANDTRKPAVTFRSTAFAAHFSHFATLVLERPRNPCLTPLRSEVFARLLRSMTLRFKFLKRRLLSQIGGSTVWARLHARRSNCINGIPGIGWDEEKGFPCLRMIVNIWTCSLRVSGWWTESFPGPPARNPHSSVTGLAFASTEKTLISACISSAS